MGNHTWNHQRLSYLTSEQVQREIGSLVVDVKLPTAGQVPTGSYEGEGFVILRHPDTAVVQDALHRLISLVRVELG